MRISFNWFRRNRHPTTPFSISVGSSVVTPKNNIGNVRAIVGGEAWVKTGKGQNVVVRLDLLRQPDFC